MTINGEHFEALYRTLDQTIGDYVRHFSGTVHIEVVQAAIMGVLIQSFDGVETPVRRKALLESMLIAIAEGVKAIDIEERRKRGMN